MNVHEQKPLNTMASYIIAMETSIQVSTDLLNRLKSMKMNDKESYENIIWELIEDHMELSEETKRDIAISEKQIKEGKTVSLEEIRRKLKARNVCS